MDVRLSRAMRRIDAKMIGVGLLIATSVGERVEDALTEVGVASPALLRPGG